MISRLSLLLLLLVAGLAGLGGCVEPYAPAIISAPPAYLVVDGFLNPRGVSTIRLSRSAALDAKTVPPAEARATLFIETQGGGPRYALTETTPGTYVSAALTLDAARQYRLRISTRIGRQYASDFVPVKLTPPVDAVSWGAQGQDFNIYVSAHDDTRNSQYYRWEYDETWEVSSPYQPLIEYYDGALRPIRQAFPLVCWSTASSSRIVLNQTIALSEDRVTNFRMLTLPANTSRLARRYSILVHQQALTKAEYAYWDLLRKNTENIGSLFDPQPSQVTGNMHNLDDGQEPVLGFVGAHSVSDKRIFISRAELPAAVVPLSGYEACLPPDTLKPASGIPPPTAEDIRLSLFYAFNSQKYLPIEVVPGGVTAKERDCIDCRTRGTAVRPSFW
ncbi:DUF4249 domain-containing protein [Hymenobacter amundsenii]|uniref:DUF4249 domain-containing protein n=1 Tax=Hymenobacter amundsenii TaxID=2006685 RepID=UPI001F5BA364|nr:DUF4249 domain-containing protein [Hymenobacter amundsenii]